VASDFEQSASGVVRFGIAGTAVGEFCALNVVGEVRLAGTIDALLDSHGHRFSSKGGVAPAGPV
jgi:hypothetical protein